MDFGKDRHALLLAKRIIGGIIMSDVSFTREEIRVAPDPNGVRIVIRFKNIKNKLLMKKFSEAITSTYAKVSDEGKNHPSNSRS